MGALVAGVDDDAVKTAGGGDVSVAGGGRADGLSGIEGWNFFFIWLLGMWHW